MNFVAVAAVNVTESADRTDLCRLFVYRPDAVNWQTFVGGELAASGNRRYPWAVTWREPAAEIRSISEDDPFAAAHVA